MGGMNGQRSNEYSSLRLAKPRALPDDMRSGVVEVLGLKTRKDKQGQGYASALLQEVCQEADIAMRFLFLHVEPFGSMSIDDLSKFYAKRGFMVLQDTPRLMVRPFQGAYGHG